MTEQTLEVQNLLTEIKTGWSGVSALPAEFKTLRDGADKLAIELRDVRRQVTSRLATRKVLESLTDADLERLYRRSMKVSRPDAIIGESKLLD